MTSESDSGTATATPPGPAKTFDRVFLLVVDESPELAVALRYACLRARKTSGRVALLYVIEPGDAPHFLGVHELMQEEQRQAAEQLMQKRASEVHKLSGSMPVLYVREGQRTEQLLKLLAEEPGISILVLGAASGGKGPGPIISALTAKNLGQLRVPVTIVPGGLTEEEIDKIA